MNAVHSPEVIAEYLQRFNSVLVRAGNGLKHTIANMIKASITPNETGNVVAEIVIELPASSDYLSYRLASRAIDDIMDDLNVWIDTHKKDMKYSRQIVNNQEIITISFTK